jgi:hypothetical protein
LFAGAVITEQPGQAKEQMQKVLFVIFIYLESPRTF